MSRVEHEHVMTTKDQDVAHDLKNEFLGLCLKRKVSTLVALAAARCAADCFESIINEQGGEVFTVATAPTESSERCGEGCCGHDPKFRDGERRCWYNVNGVPCVHRCGWVTLGRVAVDVENETETLTPAATEQAGEQYKLSKDEVAELINYNLKRLMNADCNDVARKYRRRVERLRTMYAD